MCANTWSNGCAPWRKWFPTGQAAGEAGPCALSSWAQESVGLGGRLCFQVNAQGSVVGRRTIDFSCNNNSDAFVQYLSEAELCLIIFLFWFWFFCLFWEEKARQTKAKPSVFLFGGSWGRVVPSFSQIHWFFNPYLMSAYCVLLWGLWEKCKAWGCVRGQPCFWSPQSSLKVFKSSPKSYVSKPIPDHNTGRNVQPTVIALWPGASVPLPHSCLTPCELVLLFREMAWQPNAESFLFAGPVYLLTAIAGKNCNTYCLPWGGVGSSYSPLRGHRPTEKVTLFPAPCGETGIFITVNSQEHGNSNAATSLQSNEKRITKKPHRWNLNPNFPPLIYSSTHPAKITCSWSRIPYMYLG